MFEYDLVAQFRCGGSDTYVRWVDRLLGISTDGDEILDIEQAGFDFSVVDSPAALEREVHQSLKKGQNSRLVAGFCWAWSDPLGDGTLRGCR